MPGCHCLCAKLTRCHFNSYNQPRAEPSSNTISHVSCMQRFLCVWVVHCVLHSLQHECDVHRCRHTSRISTIWSQWSFTFAGRLLFHLTLSSSPPQASSRCQFVRNSCSFRHSVPLTANSTTRHIGTVTIDTHKQKNSFRELFKLFKRKGLIINKSFLRFECQKKKYIY